MVDPVKMQTPGQIFQCLLYIDLSLVKTRFLGAILQCKSKVSALEHLMLQNSIWEVLWVILNTLKTPLTKFV
jgi:hypothetical protein